MRHEPTESAIRTELKVVGTSGQLSLGKRYAGRALRMEVRDDGAILLTPVVMVPESQLWTLAEPDRSRIARGIEWAAGHPPEESDLDALASRASQPRKRPRSRGSR